jgi:hypothetical protein
LDEEKRWRQRVELGRLRNPEPIGLRMTHLLIEDNEKPCQPVPQIAHNTINSAQMCSQLMISAPKTTRMVVIGENWKEHWSSAFTVQR